MNKVIYLSLGLSAMLCAEVVELEKINVTEKVGTKVIEKVAHEELKSSDLAEALTQATPSIGLIRRSGIANDIVYRGVKRDNINVTVDGTKVCGACPNRMDPPTSHVMTQNVESVEIKPAVFDVEEFGGLVGDIKIKTLKPQEGFGGEASIGVGSFGYKKGAVTASGGNDKVKVLISASKEKGGQYKDGNGDTFAQQLDNQIAKNPAVAGTGYKSQYKELDAFERESLMSKVFIDIDDNQALNLSYTRNRSENILYPNSPMDALYDDSDIYNMEYSISNLAPLSKKLELQAYQSEVEHPMSTMYRNSSGATLATEMTHKLTTKMQGVKLKNSFDIDAHDVMVGMDTSKRNWDGAYYKNGTPVPTNATSSFRSIYDVDTKNNGIFIKDNFKVSDNLKLEMGMRFDDTKITPDGTQQQNDYSSLNGNILATYSATDSLKYFAGVGKSSRVPDARELYFIDKSAKVIGTPTLQDTKNYETDIGVEKKFDNGTLKSKAFYSKLKDYIYNNSLKTTNSFENIDATLYGAEVSGTFMATDALSLDGSVVYTKGEQDNLLVGHTTTNLPDIAPLTMKLGANYDFDTARASLEFISRANWSDIDIDAGEQKLAGYGVVNFKYNKELQNGFDITFGMDNIFDKTYVVSNTQRDLTLVGGTSTMLLNEAGRNLYFNTRYKF